MKKEEIRRTLPICATSLLSASMALTSHAQHANGQDQAAPTKSLQAISSAAPSTLSVILEPKMGGADENSFVAVSETFDAPGIGAGGRLLQMPLFIHQIQTVADSLVDLTVTDSTGPLALTSSDELDPVDSDHLQFRHWSVDRAVNGPVTVSYRAPITNLPNPRPAPPFELRSADGGMSGLTSSFLILPDGSALHRLDLHWRFSPADDPSVGASTLGFGDVTSAAPLAATELGHLFVMGGRIQTFPAAPAEDGFLGVWQGTPPFDGKAAMQWTRGLYDRYLEFFHASGNRPFTVFLRGNPNGGGGVAVERSFIGTFTNETQLSSLEPILAHEMVHTFVGTLDDRSTVSAWYSEGIAVNYERHLLLRFGLISAAEFLKDLNSTAARYYTNPAKNAPNADIGNKFWSDPRVRVLPYDRGSLYMAMVNEKVRKASNGSRSLDDLVLSMMARGQRGEPMDQKAWVQTVTADLGPEGQADYEAMLSGKLLVPASDSFGACFERVTMPLRQFDYGFAPEILGEPHKIVRGLKPGSEAAKAGLKNGDELIRSGGGDLPLDQAALLHLHVRRDGKPLEIAYLARGKTVRTYHWVPKPECGVAGSGPQTKTRGCCK